MPEFNVTIDNTNRTAIHLYPPLCGGDGWVERTEDRFAFNSTYTYCHGQNHPRAEFKFTGIAVYAMLARYETPENMWLYLDGYDVVFLDLTSPTGGDVESQVLWGMQNLPYKEHTLEVLPGRYDGGEFGYVNVDAFIYTDLDEEGQRAYTAKLAGNSEVDKAPIGIGIGVGLGVAVIILLLAVFFYLRQRKPKVQLHEKLADDSTGHSGFIAPGDFQQQYLASPNPNNVSPENTGLSQGYVPPGPSFVPNRPMTDPNNTAAPNTSNAPIFV